jgi:hypothetical protein
MPTSRTWYANQTRSRELAYRRGYTNLKIHATTAVMAVNRRASLVTSVGSADQMLVDRNPAISAPNPSVSRISVVVRKRLV